MASASGNGNIGSPPGGNPPNVVQATGRVAETIIGGFAGAPALLLIVVLNVAAMGAATYFLLQMNEQQSGSAREVIDVLRVCMDLQSRRDLSEQQKIIDDLRQHVEDERTREAEERAREVVRQKELEELHEEREAGASEAGEQKPPARPDEIIRRHGGQR